MIININNKIVVRFLLLIFILFSKDIYTNDFNQFLPETLDSSQEKNSQYLIEKYKKKTGDSYIVGTSKNLLGPNNQEDYESPHLVQKNTNQDVKVKNKTHAVYTTKWDKLSQTNLKNYLNSRMENSDHSIGINLLYNKLDYTNGSFDFSQMYLSSDESNLAIMVLVNYQKYLNDNILKFGLNFNSGLGVHSGVGYFKGTSTKSYTNFKLWSLPIDMGGSINLDIMKALSVNLSGGLSLIGVIENRDDKSEESGERNIYQFSYGSYFTGSLDINFYHLFPRYIFEIYRDYNAKTSYVSLFTRYSNYSSFQESTVSISGLSYGIGFKVEFY